MGWWSSRQTAEAHSKEHSRSYCASSGGYVEWTECPGTSIIRLLSSWYLRKCHRSVRSSGSDRHRLITSTSNQPLSSPVPVTVFGLFLFLFAWRLCSLGHTYFKSWHHFPNSVGGTWTYGTSAGQASSWGPFIIASITIHPLHRWSLNYCVVI